MKRFKTKRRSNNRKKINFFILIILLLIIFIFLSFKKLNNNYDLFINLLFHNTSFKSDDKLLIIHNLDFFIPNYAFNNTKKVINEVNNKKIYLYNTHNLESYKDNKSVIDASICLSNNLLKLGIKSDIEEKKTSDYLVTGLNYYEVSRTFLKEKINNNYDYYIDIHRDSATDTKIKINNKNYAKVLFVLGLENKNYEKNKELLVKMHTFLNNNYPGLSKGILEKKGSDVNGVYNQDLGSNFLLIEIGGVDNNLEEVNNTTEVLALMLDEI